MTEQEVPTEEISFRIPKSAARDVQRLGDLLWEVGREIQRARGLFPDPNLLALAFGEEAGELTKAVLEEPLDAVRKEAIQAAAMALRLVLDGDPSTDTHRERQGLKKLGETVKPSEVGCSSCGYAPYCLCDQQ
jgi:hypothetical protein